MVVIAIVALLMAILMPALQKVKEQARYNQAEPLLLQALEGRRLKLGDTHPHTLESWHNLIELYETWGKPEKAKEWRAKLPETEAVD